MNTFNSQKNAETEREGIKYRQMDRYMYIHCTITLSELKTLGLTTPTAP